MKTMTVRLTFTDDLLGTSPADPELYKTWIAEHANPDKLDQELKNLGEAAVTEQKMTLFHRNKEGQPLLYAYQVRGFFKEACGMLRRVVEDGKKEANRSVKLKAYKKIVDGLITVDEDEIPLIFDGEVTTLQRPLRTSDANGDRTALAISECVPKGATATFTIRCLSDDHMDIVREWLDYGRFHGMLQWRNSGKGRFVWEEVA